MAKGKLALYGGEKHIGSSFKSYNSIGIEELNAAKAVIESGVLSKFLGAWDKDFFGGPCVQSFERDCEKYFDVKHAVTVNSWTSGLVAAVGAIDIEPGDEIITTPWTMCATATAILAWNAIPIFADICPDTFNIDPVSVKNNITEKTKAIMAVDIFGQSCQVNELKKICEEFDLKLILDSAQSPGAIHNNAFAGTLGDVGGFSLNYHKHIHTGEGGILVTNCDKIAEKLQLIRNHAEAVVADKGVTDLSNMLGYNFRMGEIEAAIGIEQLKKLKKFTNSRQSVAQQLNIGLKELPGLNIPKLQDENTHVYYVYGMTLDVQLLGVSRNKIFEALSAEGVEGLMCGYANIHMLPMYQNKIAYGSGGFPWSADFTRKNIEYDKGICPIAERLQDETFLGFETCLHDLSKDDVYAIVGAFHKVWANLNALRD